MSPRHDMSPRHWPSGRRRPRLHTHAHTRARAHTHTPCEAYTANAAQIFRYALIRGKRSPRPTPDLSMHVWLWQLRPSHTHYLSRVFSCLSIAHYTSSRPTIRPKHSMCVLVLSKLASAERKRVALHLGCASQTANAQLLRRRQAKSSREPPTTV